MKSLFLCISIEDEISECCHDAESYKNDCFLTVLNNIVL